MANLINEMIKHVVHRRLRADEANFHVFPFFHRVYTRNHGQNRDRLLRNTEVLASASAGVIFREYLELVQNLQSNLA